MDLLFPLVSLIVGGLASLLAEAARRGIHIRSGVRPKGESAPRMGVSLLGFSVEIGPPEPSESPRARVDRLTRALGEAADVAREIESELKERSQVVEQLERDIEQYSQLAELKKEEMEAVASMVRGEIRQESKRTFWQNVGLNFVFFVAGIATTLAVGHWS